jgi:hypothetical protein
MSHDAPTFFVDYELIRSDVGSSPRVCFTFRVGEHVIGDDSVEVDARAVIAALRPILRHDSDRRDDPLAALPLAELLPRLEVGVIVYADPGMDAGSDWKRFVRFVALPRECATFKNWSGFLVEDGAHARLVWREPDRALREARLSPGELELALRAFAAELESAGDARHSLAPRSGERLKSSADLGEAPASRRAETG